MGPGLQRHGGRHRLPGVLCPRDDPPRQAPGHRQLRRREELLLLPTQRRRAGHRTVELPLRHRLRHVRRGHRGGQPCRLQTVEPVHGRGPSPRRDLPRGRPARRRVQLPAGPQFGHRRLPGGQPQGQRHRVHRFDGRGTANQRASRTDAGGPDIRQARRLRDGRQERHHPGRGIRSRRPRFGTSCIPLSATRARSARPARA